MNDLSQSELDYALVEKAIRYLNTNARERPSLEALAAHLAVSPQQFQGLCIRWACVGAQKLMAVLAPEHLKAKLTAGWAEIPQAVSSSALSGAERLREFSVNLVTMAPDEYKTKGRLLKIRYGFHPTPFGCALICIAGPGICSLSFVDRGQDSAALRHQKRRWPLSDFVLDAAATAHYINRIFSFESASVPDKTLNCLIKGTSFQCNVWKTLLRIPPGDVTTYGHIAAAAGQATAVRAAANAVGLNPVAYLIPCHRVIRASGALGGYRWDTVRKQAMIAREFAGCSAAGRS